MIIYREKGLVNNTVSQGIISFYPQATILDIDNYKNIFDKNISGNTEKTIIIASVKNALGEAPKGYGFEGTGYFLKNSLNCIYDCSYCYLKGAFKNDMLVYFVNYDDIQKQINLKMQSTNEIVWFYSSDYSDNLATNTLTHFCEYFIPVIEQFPNARMEIRTKSSHIAPLLAMNPPHNTEIAFSLNPQSIIEKYEKKTPSLDLRLQAINTLIDAGWKVGIRFLPLLEIENYQTVYPLFIDYVIQHIAIEKIHSIFIGGLMFTHDDYKAILKKEGSVDILYQLEKNNDGFMREKKEVRAWFYQLFGEKFGHKKCQVCLDQAI